MKCSVFDVYNQKLKLTSTWYFCEHKWRIITDICQIFLKIFQISAIETTFRDNLCDVHGYKRMIKEFINWNSLILSNLTEIFSEPHAFMLSEVAARRRLFNTMRKNEGILR